MANFFVGQKVRILYSNTFPELKGCTGRIIKCVGGFLENGDDARCEYEVAPDHWGSSESPDGSALFAPNSSQLEPILPEGARPSEFSFTELMDNLGVVVA